VRYPAVYITRRLSQIANAALNETKSMYMVVVLRERGGIIELEPKKKRQANRGAGEYLVFLPGERENSVRPAEIFTPSRS